MTRELILRITEKDFDITFIRSGGPGGQHRNKTSTGVRMKHPASGVVVEATEERSQHQNRRVAWARMQAHDGFKRWLRVAIAEANGQVEPVAQRVEREMRPENIRTQVLDGRDAWVDIDPSQLT